jgi:hypothetical protein
VPRIASRPYSTSFRLLRRIIFSGRASGVGQSATPSFATATEELALIPDADEANCWPASGGRSHRRPAASTRRQVLPNNRPPQRAAVASESGQQTALLFDLQTSDVARSNASSAGIGSR